MNQPFHEHHERDDLTKSVHAVRKAAGKEAWWQWIGDYIDSTGASHRIQIKGYGPWMQIFTINGIKHGGIVTEKVKDMTALLEKAFSSLPE